MFLPLTIWIIYLGTFLFGLIRYKYFITVKQGIIHLIISGGWHLSSVIGLMFLLVLALFFCLFLDGRLFFKDLFSCFIIGLMAFVTLLVSAYMILGEELNFDNYLYSRYGIARSDFEFLSQVSMMAILIVSALFFIKQKKLFFDTSDRKLVAIPFILILVWYSLTPYIKQGYVFSYANFSFNQEFANFSVIQDLARYVPPGGTVILHVQDINWPDISNTAIVRYFTFPRTVVSSSYISDQESAGNLGTVYFETINKNGVRIWPKIDSKNKKVYFIENIPVKYFSLAEIRISKSGVLYKITF